VAGDRCDRGPCRGPSGRGADKKEGAQAQALGRSRGEPVIPPRRHRKHQHRYDRIAYKQRWGIEGFFAKLKEWRRIATRYDKLAANFLGFLKLASIMLWII
tara:strand:- start:16136 stop:16438 length:303 start_codon:yes stop_codon:yes gene_type:complete